MSPTRQQKGASLGDSMLGGDVEIIIVSFNTREMTLECLESVKAGLGDLAANIWIVDNGSADGSVAAVKERYADVNVVENRENRGFAGANNQVLAKLASRYALLLNSDTVVLKDVLIRTVEYMERHPEVGVLGCRVLNPDGTMQRTCFQEPSLLNLFLKTTGLFRLAWPRFFGREQMMAWNRDSERDVPVVTGCYMLVRKSAIDDVGILDESFFFCGEETDWCRRFRRAGWAVRFAPVGEIIHYGNASGRQLRAQRDVYLSAGLVRFHRKHGGRLHAMFAWGLLWVFNVARWVLWSAVQCVPGRHEARVRQSHFRDVVRRFGDVWPRDTCGEGEGS